MELEVVDKKENPLLNRIEIKFRIVHEAASTPARKDVREAIAKMMGTAKEKVVVAHLSSIFGKAESSGYAKIYKTKKEAMTVEIEKIKRKHGLTEPKKEKKKAEADKAEAPAEGAEEKKAE